MFSSTQLTTGSPIAWGVMFCLWGLKEKGKSQASRGVIFIKRFSVVKLQIAFNVHPYLGKMSNLTHSFSDGLVKNHQPTTYVQHGFLWLVSDVSPVRPWKWLEVIFQPQTSLRTQNVELTINNLYRWWQLKLKHFYFHPENLGKKWNPILTTAHMFLQMGWWNQPPTRKNRIRKHHQKHGQESNSLGDAKHERIAGGERGTGESVGTSFRGFRVTWWLILCPCGIFRSQNTYKEKEVLFVSTVFLVDLTMSYNKQVRLQTRSVAGFISPNKHIMLVDAMAPWSPTD